VCASSLKVSSLQERVKVVRRVDQVMVLNSKNDVVLVDLVTIHRLDERRGSLACDEHP